MLQLFLKVRKLKEATAIFNEMVKNECCPTAANCASAIRIFLDSRDWEMAVKVWKCMVANDLQPLEKSGNMLIEKLRDMDGLPEACKYAEDVIDRGIKLNSSTLSKLRQSLLKVGKGTNCASAIRIFLDSRDWEMAVKVWKCMVANDLQPLEKSGNMLIEKLRDMDGLPEACKYAEDVIDRGIKLNSSTLSKLRQSLLKVGKGSIHDHLLERWKSH
ncbi:putative pentatricopeptide repeat-containing protein, mitochondrial [Cocos nucifera]|uniref:Putative pentatricopeptide repeat-containing protein, mitochondrial n=1 Tax=Cocos nucifera TaxID=13894 RepID=A0A8K0I9C0_COCNU|nr:putative pentatricopeptide repeat-containing protein, mitochondrial [Cocos nucifera]